jgi:ankyrin repeat protein
MTRGLFPMNNRFEDFPIDILFKIFSYLAPEDLANAAQVSKRFNRVNNMDEVRAQQFWKMKFSIHFPFLCREFNNTQNLNWYKEFKNAYDMEYKGLSGRARNLFSLVKEGDIESLKNNNPPLSIDDLVLKNMKGYCLIDFAHGYKYQHILDFFYREVICEYYQDEFYTSVLQSDKDGRSLLFLSVACDQAANVINDLISAGALVNAARNDGVSVLMMAIARGRSENISALLSCLGIRTNAVCKTTGDTALHVAAMTNNIDSVNALLAHHDYYVNRAINVNAENNDSMTALCIAAQMGHLDIVYSLLDHPDIQVGNALPIALLAGNHEIIKVLLAHPTTNLNFVDSDGVSALFYAANQGFLDIVNAFLAYPQINVNAEYKGETALTIAAKNGHDDVVKALQIKLLENYIATRRNEPDYKTRVKIFGKTINFGKSGQEKIKAAEGKLHELRGEVSNISKQDEEALNQGDLKKIANPKFR